MASSGLSRLSGWVARSAGSVVDAGDDLVRGIWGDDDPEGEELEPLPVVDDPELDELDDPSNDDETVTNPDVVDPARLPALLARLDPPPPLPLSAPFSAGLGPLLGRWIEIEPEGVLADSRARRVVRLVGSRFTITVSDETITVTGLFRSRSTPWSRVQEATMEDRYDLFTQRVIAGSVAMLLGRGLLPIPGLSWLLRGVIGLMEGLVPDAWRDSMRHESGRALASIRRSAALDIELAGPLALVAFLSEGLSAAVADVAERHGKLTTV